MVTSTLKTYTNEDIIKLINQIKDKDFNPNMTELKSILAEVNNRKLDQEYSNLLGDMIRNKILYGENEEITEQTIEQEQPQEELEQDEKPAKKRREKARKEKNKENNEKKVTDIKEKQKSQVVAEELAEEEDDDGYPVLRFSTVLFKVFGWFGLVGFLGFGIYESLTKYLTNVNFAIGSIFANLLYGTATLFVFYLISESISLKLEINKNLKNKQ